MDLVGKILKSKINGKLFYISELFTDKSSKMQYYSVGELGTNNYVAVSKEWFEIGYMENLEIINIEME